MADILYSIDVEIFYFINHTLSNSLFDKLMPYLTEVKHWYLTYIILILICYFKGGRIGKIAAVGAIFLIIASDQFSSSFLKNLFGRPRPCKVLPDVNILAFCSGSGSFPSSHAVNNFAAAFFFYRLFPKLKWILISVAALMAFTRPYVGVHYPSDIVAGAIIGSGIGYLFSYIALKVDGYFKLKEEQ